MSNTRDWKAIALDLANKAAAQGAKLTQSPQVAALRDKALQKGAEFAANPKVQAAMQATLEVSGKAQQTAMIWLEKARESGSKNDAPKQ